MKLLKTSKKSKIVHYKALIYVLLLFGYFINLKNKIIYEINTMGNEEPI